MVFVKLLGIFDLLIASVLLLLHFDFDLSWRFILVLSVILVFKAYVFQDSFMSVVDGVVGIYLIVLLLGFHSVLTFVPFAFMVQKGLFSLI